MGEDRYIEKMISIKNHLRMTSISKKLLCVICLIAAASGCDPFYSTDESYNSNARPPETLATRITDFGELKNGQHVAGYLDVAFTPDTLTDIIEGIGFCMDGECDPYYYGGMGTIVKTISRRPIRQGPMCWSSMFFSGTAPSGLA